ncbi:MAG: uroporphyrinogen decarboxylase [Armatimonadota bacterium]|nr:uroporphyrinogen decarboxylase [Armatimonadota bacterium]MDR7444643.1 uroporphyrinogen decarboxylase [Armatimonadota bacterium]MDR7569469.1 uroporphyrinogen decarboxylase [Armatimonadota bacterium]MDR7613648.1 uroporphyrinogen decarboxylase [Armatimonadota bacterium]
MRDRILRAARAEPVDTTPVWFMRQAGRYLPEYRALRRRYPMRELLRTPELAAEITLMPLRRLDVDAAILYSDLLVPLWGMGLDFHLAEGRGPVVRVEVERLAHLPELDPDRVRFTFEAIRLLRSALDRPLIGFAGAPFTVAAYLLEGQTSRDWPRTRAFLHRHPDVWHRLLDILARNLGLYLRAQVEAGAQLVQIFDSWVGVLSGEDFVAFVRPYLVAMLETVGAAVPRIYFSTGSSHLLGHLADLPAEVIGVDWRVRLQDAAVRSGKSVVQGNLDPALLLGEEARLLSRTDAILEEGRRLAGHIFNLGHGVPPEADPGRLAMLVHFVHERGRREGRHAAH